MKNLSYSLRYLLKSRAGNLTRLVSLSLGLFVGLYCITYAVYELTFDRFLPDRDRVYQLWSASSLNGESENSAMLLAPIAPAIAAEMPAVEAATRLPWPFTGYSFYYEDREFPAAFIMADTSFFRVLDFGVVRGDASSLAVGDNIMISESYARRIFGSEDPLGKTLMFKNKFPRTVSGIFRDIPGNCSLGKFDAICSWEQVASTGWGTGWDGGDSFLTFVKLRPGARIEEIEAAMPDFFERYGLTETIEEWRLTFFFVPLDKVRNRMMGITEVMVIVAALGFLTLLVAALNYVLISLSLLVRRSRTLAMLRCSGARRTDVFAMFMWETLLVTVAAVVGAFLLALFLQNEIKAVTDVDIWELLAWNRIWAPLSVIAAAFLMSSLIPASIFSSVKLTAAFKSSAESRRRWKHALLFVQLACAAFIMALLLIIALQFRRLGRQEYGYEHDNLIFTELVGRPSDFSKFKDELLKLPQVRACALSYELPCWGYSGMPCVDENTGELLFSCRYGSIDEDFIPAMGMRMVAGENFSADAPDNGVIVNETYVRMRGWKDNPVGRLISDGRETGMTVLGVVADYNMYQYQAFPEPVVLHPIRMEDNKYYGGSRLLIQLSEMSPENVEAVRAALGAMYSVEPFEITVYNDCLYSDLRQESKFGNVVLILSVIVVFIALMGVTGYVSDETGRRGREVAVRKVCGAGAFEVVWLMARNIVLLSLPAVALGLAAAYWYGGVWLEQYRHKTALSWWIFAAAAFTIICAVAVTLTAKTYRMASSAPARTIKTE